ncbi:MAG: type VI secretion system tube protein Hcp, partial [Proteobacteria bacterium]|nr:type VI secretion system tube protein Hcp [Pseudomonadota bacterium]
MSLPIHVEIIGEKQGPIKGSCDMEGREGTIFVEYTNHEVQIPSGEKGGKRIHAPYIISKPIDMSSP